MTPIIFKFLPCDGYIERSQCAKYFFHMLLFGGFFEGFSFANKADNLNFQTLKQVEFEKTKRTKLVKDKLIFSFE